MKDKESRLLTDEELNRAWDRAFDKPVDFAYKPKAKDILAIRLRAVAEAQDGRTSFIKDSECQAKIKSRVKAIFIWIDGLVKLLIEESFVACTDEQVLIVKSFFILHLLDKVKARKKREGIK